MYQTMKEKRFNIRVYGIVINDRNELLVSDEMIRGLQFTKFPGGGLEWGEGIRECLEREFKEELNQPIQVGDHFYTTDYFQQSAFLETDQLISIYFKVALQLQIQFEVKTNPFDFPDQLGNQMEVHRWVKLDELSENDFKWPVDKHVVAMLKAIYSGDSSNK